ncbi:MAG: 1,4-alpha-glucan branching protein GlgB [Clostridiaceae bacterium]|nr:1,4-alpha-glucan branching protein GlgB [Clostridiaceae bacterium]
MNNEILKSFHNGECFDSYKFFGAHITNENGVSGVRFNLYAPNALDVQVIGEFNGWTGEFHRMNKIDNLGTLSLFVPEAKENMMYKYRVTQIDGTVVDKADPYAFYSELRPNTASIITNINNSDYFHDDEWMNKRTKNYNDPLNIYELHLGSWKKKDSYTWYKYDEIADKLIDYLLENNFTHVEIMPLSEYPFDASWGYEASSYFSATSRYGKVQDLMYLIDKLHQNKIGVILDFVPVHFVRDNYSLAKFDGTPLYEYDYEDIANSEWGSCNFDFYKNEIVSFLMSAASFWLDVYHIDGLRMDAISNAIYWQGNSKRGENIGGVNFLKKLNKGLNEMYPGIMLIAEDSSNYNKVTAPVEYGGLGFDYKWDLGWMHDTLKYFSMDPIYRKYNHNLLTFSMSYFYYENYILAFSHDEVVHGKKTIIDKIWGNYEQKFAQCRTLYTYMMTHPGKKLNFMGNEIAHFREWDENVETDWFLQKYPAHDYFHEYFKKLTSLYKKHNALHCEELSEKTFTWIDPDDCDDNVISYVRMYEGEKLLVVLNMSPNNYRNFRVGVKNPCSVKEILNSEQDIYGGCNITNPQLIHSQYVPTNRWSNSIKINLAPFASCIFDIKE